jgi:geranylgeranyl diphosphate synthase, type II
VGQSSAHRVCGIDAQVSKGAMHKTCWDTTIHPLRVGALVGSAGTADLASLVRFGFHFGAAFQIRDDLLNLVGDERAYGKEILGDLYEGKHLAAGAPDGQCHRRRLVAGPRLPAA